MTDTFNTENPTFDTVKAFMETNAERLFVKNKGDYIMKYDSFEYWPEPRPWRSVAGQFTPNDTYSFGIGVWFVNGSGRNDIRPYSDGEGYQGFEVTNCYSAFVVAVKN
jgi:hypothetical protein